MKNGVCEGFYIKCKKEEREFVSEEEEVMFWEKKLFGIILVKLLLNIMYFYNGKIFGLCGGDYRKIVVNNFEIGFNFIKFEENVLKIYYGGLCDFKYVFWKVKYVCYFIGEKYELLWCFVEIYILYIGLVEIYVKVVIVFYFKLLICRLVFEKVLVGINSLNKILFEMCELVGFKCKIVYSLCVICVFFLFNVGVDEKLICERLGY